jgi:hypothetical protein
MRFLSTVLIFLLLTTACKKTVEKVQEDALVKIITNGQWVVTKFTSGTTDVTSNYGGYRFQFKSDKTVDAIKNGAVEKTGTWDGNAYNKTIISSFTNASSPLMLLNGTWHVTDSGLSYVVSTQESNGETKTLRLDKQ